MSDTSSLQKEVDAIGRSVDQWNNWYVVGLVGALLMGALTLVATQRSFSANKKLGVANAKLTLAKEKEAKTRTTELETKLEEQREKTALAEKATLDLQRLIREPRTIDRKRADEILDSGEKGSVDILPVTTAGNDPVILADQLAEILSAHGWKILRNEPRIVGGDQPRPGIVITVYGDRKGTEVISDWNNVPQPAKTLHRLLVEALTGNPMVETRVSPEQPKDRLLVMIGGKY